MKVREPKPGDVYVVQKSFETLATQCDGLPKYEVGDTLIICGPTEDNPFATKTTHSHWKVRCKNYRPPQDESIWTWIPGFIEDGLIKLGAEFNILLREDT